MSIRSVYRTSLGLLFVVATTIATEQPLLADVSRVIVMRDVDHATEQRVLDILRRLANVAKDNDIEVNNLARVASVNRGPRDNHARVPQRIRQTNRSVPSITTTQHEATREGAWFQVPVICHQCGRVKSYQYVFYYRCARCGKYHLQ